jgi:hypothetical protein
MAILEEGSSTIEIFPTSTLIIYESYSVTESR